jgi:protocadherin-16/23
MQKLQSHSNRTIFFTAGTELGTVLTSITANDVDTNPALTYSFGEMIHAENEAALDVDDETNSWFSIDRFSGKIILQKRLDYEARQEYQLKIVASDAAHVAQTTLTIRVTDVNDNAPVFQEPAYHTTLPGKRIAGIRRVWTSAYRFFFSFQTRSAPMKSRSSR